MNNVKELRDSLLKKFASYNHKTDDGELNALTACASAIIRSAKVELDYKIHKNDDSEIEFLKTK